MVKGQTVIGPVLCVINKLNLTHGKLYCYPSQLKIIELLDTYHNIKIGIASLNRWLRYIEDRKYLSRIRRFKNDKKLGRIFQSTIYKINLKGYQKLHRMGISVWRQIKAVTTAGLKASERGLSKFTGPVSLKTIYTSMMLFGVEGKQFIVEE